MNLGLEIKEYQDLETHLNLSKDFTGSLQDEVYVKQISMGELLNSQLNPRITTKTL